MKFSILTPSLNMLPHLRRCCRSVKDQGVDLEHIIMDGRSTDGTVEWLQRQTYLSASIEKDRGMYDALNRGLDKASGDVFGHLNCDEQYLPGTLQVVEKYFETNPDVDLLCGDTLLVDIDGKLLAYRKSFQPRLPYVWQGMAYVSTCATFARKRVFQSGLRYNSEYKIAGDQDLIIRMLQNRIMATHVPRYLSTFCLTGSNLSSGPSASLETAYYTSTRPSWLKVFSFPVRALAYLEKAFSGAYHQHLPLTYDIYVGDEPLRYAFIAKQATYKWPKMQIQNSLPERRA
jgi:glycosyltransferase involved in cell wall biosynthesis